MMVVSGVVLFVTLWFVGLVKLGSALVARGLLIGHRKGDAATRAHLIPAHSSSAWRCDTEPIGAVRERSPTRTRSRVHLYSGSAFADAQALELSAIVEVKNPGEAPVVVSCQMRVLTSWWTWMRDPLSITVPSKAQRLAIPDGTLLGVADVGESRCWSMPVVVPPRARGVALVLRLDQCNGRVRRITHVLTETRSARNLPAEASASQ
jgi:hypothetical protein